MYLEEFEAIKHCWTERKSVGCWFENHCFSGDKTEWAEAAPAHSSCYTPCFLVLILLCVDISRAASSSRTLLPPRGRLATSKEIEQKSQTMQFSIPAASGAMAAFLMLILLIFSPVSTGTSSPQSLKKILSLSEEGNERHRRQPEDTVSNASSQLSSPPTSPQSSPKKGKPIILPPSHTILQTPSLCHHVTSATWWLPAGLRPVSCCWALLLFLQNKSPLKLLFRTIQCFFYSLSHQELFSCLFHKTSAVLLKDFYWNYQK